MNTQIDFVQAKGRGAGGELVQRGLKLKTQKGAQAAEGLEDVTKYPKLLGKIPKYAVMEIVKNHLQIDPVPRS